MGRELKRVPLDFDWPKNKTWGGYINPFSQQSTSCHHCDGTGSSPQAKHLQDQWYGNAPFQPEDRGSKPFTIDTPEVRAFAERNVSRAPHLYGSDDAVDREAQRLINLWNARWSHHLNADDVAALIAEDRLWDLTQNQEKDYVPTPEQVNAWSIGGMGHDSINQWIVANAECKRLGYPQKCAKCAGEGELWPSEKIRKKSDAWTPSEPPTGDGYQLWGTTSEGSPDSPVFATLDDLCQWCETGATTFGSSRASAAQWKQMLSDDFVCHQEGNVIFH